MFSFGTSSKLMIFVFFIILLHLISSVLITKYAYVPIESIDYIILLSFELNAILLTSLVNTLCILLLNLYSNLNISLLLL